MAAIVTGLATANAAVEKLTGKGLLAWLGTLIHARARQAQVELPNDGLGPARAETVFASVMTVLQGMAASGKIDGKLPADEVIRAIIEAVVGAGKANGTIPSASAPVSPTARQVVIRGTLEGA